MAAREVQERPSNILALSNSAYVLWQKGETDQAWGRLEKLEALRDGDQRLYDDLETEALSEILYLYIKLEHLFKPYAISDLQEKLLLRCPHNDNLKYTLGLTLRRYTNLPWISMHRNVDFVPAVRRAVELFVQIKDREENSPDLRARAAAELGWILGWHREKYTRNAVKDERRRLELTADRCFEEALELVGNNPAVLVRAGKYFRQRKRLTESRELLQKAADLRSESKANHQLGITLKQLALQERGHQGFNPQAAVTVSTPRLSRDGRYVQEAIEHFHKSLELFDGEHNFALHDLGLIHFDLSEYDQALQQFLRILDNFSVDWGNFNRAMWQAGLVLEEMARREVNGERRKTLQEMSQLCLNLNLSNLCRQLLQTLRTTPVDEMLWVSFHSLQASPRQQPYREPERIAKLEKLMLNTVKNCRRKLPVLKDVFSYSQMQATDPDTLERAAQGYITDGRYHDALLFLSLLKLTQQRHVLATWRDADVYVRVHVLVAQDRLLRCVGRDDVLTDLNVTAAKLMFRQAFEDVFCPDHCCQGQADNSENDGLQEDEESDENETPGPGQDSLLLTTTPSPAVRTPGHTLVADAWSADLDDYLSDALNVLLLHDLRDKEAEGDARNLQAVLREICGLKTALMCDEEPLGADRSTLPDTVTKAELLVFVVRSEDVSPEFSVWLREAVNTTTAGVVGLSHTPDPPSSSHCLVTLVLNSSPLPPALQGHRSFPASSTDLLELSQGQRPRSEAWVRSACKLFSDLIGLQMEEM